MAAEYEVNIKLNTGRAETQLKNIESSITKVGKAEKQSASTTDRRVAAMVKLRNIGNDVAALESKGLDVSKAKFQLTKASEAIDKKMFLTANSRMGVVVKELGAQRNITKELERQEKARRRQRTKRAEGVALGAGFPLLFGGGAGSVLGGAAGGLTGSFGAQIALSAIGQQVDKFVAGTVEVGRALNSTGGALDLVREKSLFSSSAVEERAAALEELGKVEELAALLTEELTGKIGNEGVRSLQELGKTTDKTTRLWNELTTQLFALVSGPLNSFLQIVNQVLGAVAGAGRREAFFGGLGAQEKAARARFKELTGESLGTGRSGAEARKKAEAAGQVFLSQEAALAQSMKEFQPVNPVSIPITAKDRRRFAAKGTGADKAIREEERLQKRLAKLEEERQKVIEISRFKDQIAAAEAADDAQLVIRLQGEQKMAEIEASRKQALVGITDQREIDAINIGKATEKLATQRETERQITEEQRQRQELFQDTVADLEHQLALAQATSEAERERLRIEKKLQELREDGMSEGQIGQVGDLLKQISAENSPLNQFINQSVESLNNLEAHAVQVSQGIGNAIGNSLVSGMQGLITGATSVKQVFADMLKSIADVLAQQASQMIATYIAIGIARAFAGMGSDPAGSQGNPFGTDVVMPGPGGSAVGGGRMPLGGYAEGGYVNKPTNALIGEGGEPEYIIPASKMRESMSRYSNGSRGNSVIPANGGGSGMEDSGGGVAVAAPIDVRYSVERINSVDYVTADQFQTGMRSAAEQGAKRGEQNTLKRLQMSGGTRKRLGL